MIKKLKMWILVLCLVFVAQFLSGQESPPDALLYFIDLSEDPADGLITTSLTGRVMEEVDVLGFSQNSDPVITYRGGSARKPDDFQLSAYFTDIPVEGSDLIIATFYSVQGSRIFVQYILYDIGTEVGVGGLFTQARVGLTLFTTVNDAALALSDYLQTYLANRYVYSTRGDRVNQIMLDGEQEGVQILLASRDVGTITGGDHLIPYTPFRVGSTATMELRKRGYHSASFDVEMDTEDMQLSLPRIWPKHRIALSSFWTLGLSKGAGAGAKIYFDPDSTFAYLGFHIHDAVYSLATTASTINMNYDFSFLLGQYIIFPPQSLIRLSLGVGVGVIKTTVGQDITSVSDYNDVYINLGSPTIELNFGPLQIFARGELKYLLGVGNQLFGRNWFVTSIGTPPISFGIQVQW